MYKKKLPTNQIIYHCIRIHHSEDSLTLIKSSCKIHGFTRHMKMNYHLLSPNRPQDINSTFPSFHHREKFHGSSNENGGLINEKIRSFANLGEDLPLKLLFGGSACKWYF